MTEHPNIIWRFAVRDWVPVWDFIEANLQESVVRQQARGIGADSEGRPALWQVILVLDDDDAATTLKDWVRANDLELQDLPESGHWMSALPPIADVIGCSSLCPLLTQSGHSRTLKASPSTSRGSGNGNRVRPSGQYRTHNSHDNVSQEHRQPNQGEDRNGRPRADNAARD